MQAKNIRRRASNSTRWLQRFCRQIHLPHATFSHVQSLHKSHSTDDMCTLAQDKLCDEKHSFIHASCLTFAARDTDHFSTFSLSLSSTSPVLLSSSSPNPDLLSTHPLIHCKDPRQDGTSTEFRSSTGLGPLRKGEPCQTGGSRYNEQACDSQATILGNGSHSPNAHIDGSKPLQFQPPRGHDEQANTKRQQIPVFGGRHLESRCKSKQCLRLR